MSQICNVVAPSTPYTEWVDVATGIKIKRDGDVVTFMIAGWATITGVTIPDGFRPASTFYAPAFGRSGAGVTSTIERLDVTENGTVSFPLAQIAGTFTWMV